MRRAAGASFLCLLLAAPLPASALQARINGLSDPTVTSWGFGGGPINLSMDMCIHASGALGGNTYTVTITATPGFVLQNGLQSIPFTLFWEDSGSGHLGSSNGTQVLNTVPLLARSNGNTSNNSCPGGPNARLYIKITEAAMIAAIAGTYSKAISILIAPI